LCFEHVEHWERIASRGRPAFSSHLINRRTVQLRTATNMFRLMRSATENAWKEPAGVIIALLVPRGPGKQLPYV